MYFFYIFLSINFHVLIGLGLHFYNSFWLQFHRQLIDYRYGNYNTNYNYYTGYKTEPWNIDLLLLFFNFLPFWYSYLVNKLPDLEYNFISFTRPPSSTWTYYFIISASFHCNVFVSLSILWLHPSFVFQPIWPPISCYIYYIYLSGILSISLHPPPCLSFVVYRSIYIAI